MTEPSRRESGRELPSHGGRIMAWRIQHSASDSVRYQIEMSTPEGRFDLEARVHSGGELGLSSSEAPEWLRDYVRALFRGLWRQHHETGRWPRRITRWRGEPEASR